MAKKKISYEQAFERLEEIVNKMEGENIPLDEAVKLYKEGSELSLFLDSELKQAEKQIMLLKKDCAGAFEEVPFAEGECHDE